ncbi:MAG: bifunctional aminoglycoside phosphotransferase/ATP-binding protein [Rhizobacter sp.]
MTDAMRPRSPGDAHPGLAVTRGRHGEAVATAARTGTPEEPPAVAQSRRVVQRLADRLAGQGNAVSWLETHISWILLAGDTAYKIKKPVALGFVDATRLESRQHFCEEELRLNRRLAPGIYEGVSRITGSPDAPGFDGEGTVIEYAVRMRRFPPGALFSEHAAAGTLRPADVDALAALLARFHADAPRADADGAFGQPRQRRDTALAALDGVASHLVSRGPALSRLRAWMQSEAARLTPVWQQRANAGAVREVHGDLHLANLLRLNDAVCAFDGIDFDPSLRCIDIVDDAAFAMMDLMAHRQRPLAFRFLNAWLDACRDHDGLPLWRFALVSRALVRAHVGLIRQADGGTCEPGPTAYLDLALQLALGPRDPRLLITHGLPGSGKSVAALALAEAAGGVRLRSDVLRAGEAGARDYSPEGRQRTYDRLAALAGVSLDEGWPTVADAAFLQQEERARFAALAAARHVPFTLLDCRAPTALLQARVAARAAQGTDPSEADARVLGQLTAARAPLAPSELRGCLVLDAAEPRPLASVAAAWLAHAAG